MKLYELEHGDYFRIKNDKTRTKFILDHIDGAYSYCIETFNNEVHHISAWTEVELAN